MKKLIEELNETYNSDGVQWCDRDFQQGFKAALAIVRSHNPWISVTDELPPEWEQYRKQSIKVLVKNEEQIEISYYHFGFKSWGSTFTPTHWTYLPEVKQ